MLTMVIKTNSFIFCAQPPFSAYFLAQCCCEYLHLIRSLCLLSEEYFHILRTIERNRRAGPDDTKLLTGCEGYTYTVHVHVDTTRGKTFSEKII